MSWFQRNKKSLLVMILLLFAFFLFQANLKEPREQNWFDRFLVTVSAPIQMAIVWAVDGLGDLWTDYVWLVDVEEDNKQLRGKVEDLERKLVEYDECLAENSRLRNLVSLVDKLPERKLLAARIIGVSTSPTAQTMRLDAGLDNGVEVGDAVLAGSGLVGRVTGVVGGYSEVQLLVDARSAVDVFVQRSRARGIVRGLGESQVCLVDHLVRLTDVKVGDLMVTSGIGGLYPRGLPVGKVSMVTSPPVGVFRRAEIKPIVDFDTLEEVLVLLRKTALNTEDGSGAKGAGGQENGGGVGP